MIFFIFQSLVERLQLNAEDIAIQPVHPSIIGQDTWFQITYTTLGTTRYFSCGVHDLKPGVPNNNKRVHWPEWRYPQLSTKDPH